MKEIWKVVEDYPNYEVSNMGKVYNKKFKRFLSKGGNTYKHITLCSDGFTYCVNIHRLVAKAFIPNPLNKPQVNHIDGNKSNNNVNNLEWCTPKENHQHAVRTGLTKLKGEDNPNYKHGRYM